MDNWSEDNWDMEQAPHTVLSSGKMGVSALPWIY